MNIREYIPGDFAEISQLWNETELGGSARGDNAETIERTLKAGGKLFVLENTMSREVIGTSWLTHDHRRIYLHHFVIKPTFQGKGIAHLLMRASINFAKSTRLQIKLEVRKNNTKAINLYKKWGFNYLGDYDVYIIRDYNVIQKLS